MPSIVKIKTYSPPKMLPDAYSQEIQCPVCDETEMLHVLRGRLSVDLTVTRPCKRAIFLLVTPPVFKSRWISLASPEAEKRLIAELQNWGSVVLMGPCQTKARQGTVHWALLPEEKFCWGDGHPHNLRPASSSDLQPKISEQERFLHHVPKIPDDL